MKRCICLGCDECWPRYGNCLRVRFALTTYLCSYCSREACIGCRLEIPISINPYYVHEDGAGGIVCVDKNLTRPK